MRKYYASIVVFIFLLPVYVLAGEYVLVKGEGIEVCEAYGENLNSFNLHSEYTMACEREINPKFTDFKKPEWEELNIWENRELLKKVENFLGLGSSFGDPDKNPQEWETILKERMTGMYATTIRTAQIDINNDGKKENVIEYNYGSCPGGNYYGAALLVLNDNRNEIDIDKTKPLLQNSRYLKKGPLSEGWEFAMYDVFVYKNVTYFDRWSGNQWPVGKVGKENLKLLKVFVTKANKVGNVDTKEICEYRFRSSK